LGVRVKLGVIEGIIVGKIVLVGVIVNVGVNVLVGWGVTVWGMGLGVSVTVGPITSSFTPNEHPLRNKRPVQMMVIMSLLG
jgi:hypothetical protein